LIGALQLQSRTVTALVKSIEHRLDVHSLEELPATQAVLNEIVRVRLKTASPLPHDAKICNVHCKHHRIFCNVCQCPYFFAMIGISHWPVIAGLIIGGGYRSAHCRALVRAVAHESSIPGSRHFNCYLEPQYPDPAAMIPQPICFWKGGNLFLRLTGSDLCRYKK